MPSRFTSRQAAQARAYLARRLVSGKLAAPQARGHGKPPAQYTDAYAVRLANAQAAGKPGRQAGRGHAQTREHPRQYIYRYEGGKGRRVGSGSFVEGQRQFREYRNPAALLRWMFERLPRGIPARISAYGIVRETYTALTLSAPRGHARGAGPMTEDQRAAMQAEIDEDLYEWRSIYTGDSTGSIDLNDVEIRNLADLWAAVNRVFVPGTVDRFQLNWH